MGRKDNFSPSVGDLVWVRTGEGSDEEVAKVVKVGQEWEKTKNGVLVSLTVSEFRAVYPPSCLRPCYSEQRPKRSSRSSSPSATSVVQTAKKLKSSRHAITPSPSETTVDTQDDSKKMKAKRKLASTTSTAPNKATKNSSKVRDVTSPYFDKGDKSAAGEAASVAEATGKPAKDTKPAAKKSITAARNNPTKPASDFVMASALDSSSDSASGGDDSSDDSGTDRPFTVEYAATGRARCKRCDEVISKGAVRVGHVPLFRGKPGFKVFHHLECSIFSENIDKAEDVGGWKKLKQDDYERLVLRVEESKLEWDQEAQEVQPDELVPVNFEGEIRPPPRGLVANLLPFQVEGASWMYDQEAKKPSVRGGILADEMGMGKTLQTIVTILDNRPLLQHSKPGAKHPPNATDIDQRKAEEELWDKGSEEWKEEMNMLSVPSSLRPKGSRGGHSAGGARAGTLVICPVIALSQWKTEIEKFSEDGALTVGTYHGPKRSSETPRELLRKYDVVLTTYQVLEADFRKMTSPNKVKCPNCGGKFKVDKLRVHLKYFCGEGAERTEAQARQRRSRDRGGGSPVGHRGGVSGSRIKKNSKAKGPTTKRMTAQPKKAIRVKSTKDFDSESELSEVEAASGRGRPARSAATTAANKLSQSKGQWADMVADDSDSYDESSEEVSSDSDSDLSCRPRKKAAVAKKKKVATFSSSESDNYESEESDSESIESESPAMRRAVEKQRVALMKAKASKGKNVKSAPSSEKKTFAKGRKRGPKKGSKKFDGESSEGDSDEDHNRDPMEDIDMDKLMKEAMEGSQMSVLHSLCWWRIVLDEAHMIKSRSSQTANAAFALIGVHRWALSGTPLQNRVGEFYSLIRFLRIDPMAHYFCRAKECECKSLHYRMLNGKCQSCGHGSVQHFSHFNKHVLNPIQRSGYSGDGRRAMFTLKNEVLDKCLLRRTKETRAEDMNLPPRLVNIRSVRLHPVEEDFYNALYTQTKSSFNDYVADNTLLNNYAHIFDLLMRMRQAVDHPYLVVYSKKAGESGANGPAIANGSTDCDICHEPPTDRVVSSCCQAAYCRSCVLDYMSSLLNGSDAAHTPCPSCGDPFTIDLNQASTSVVDDETLRTPTTSSVDMPSLKELPHVATGSILRRINLAEFATSTKIEALTEELVHMRQTSPGSKAIVFSQFVNMLDLIRWRLHSDPCLAKMGLGARALHGSMDVKARDASLKDFREDKDVRVLLISLKAGGVALNLTVANHIYLMDPWWNPAAEMQAVDRTHRLGQYRPIRAVRFIAENTVEERILQLQEKKRLVFDGTVGRDAGSLKMLTVDDMKSLFT